jgi:hypothetical protein
MAVNADGLSRRPGVLSLTEQRHRNCEMSSLITIIIIIIIIVRTL